MIIKKNKTYIISEIGVNHQGKLNLAKKLIKTSKSIGVDAVKFQSFKTELLSDTSTPKVSYQKKYKPKESHFQMLKKLELSFDDQIEIYKYCKLLKIDFISTPYDIESAKFLKKIGCKIFKVASADLVDGNLHKYLNKIKAKVIISTGMSTLDEIKDTINLYSNKKNIALLHCVSNYPCSLSSLNLSNIEMLRNKFNVEVGFSDHSISNLAAIMSVALGATIIEKHFTLNRNLKGPDHEASFDPKQFIKYVIDIRNAEVSLGSKIRNIQHEEKEMRLISRKSAFLINKISKGKKINLNSVIFKRPGYGLNYFELKKIIKNKVNKNLDKNHMLKKDDFEK